MLYKSLEDLKKTGRLMPVKEKVIEPSLEGMIAWLETQPPEQEYNYASSAHCVCAQYYKSIGRDFRADFLRYTDEGDADRLFAQSLNFSVAATREGYPMEYTMGAALKRARGFKKDWARLWRS